MDTNDRHEPLGFVPAVVEKIIILEERRSTTAAAGSWERRRLTRSALADSRRHGASGPSIHSGPYAPCRREPLSSNVDMASLCH